jgi:hypothetical protein
METFYNFDDYISSPTGDMIPKDTSNRFFVAFLERHSKGEVELEDPEVQWTEIKAKRDQLLRDSDWTQTGDSPLSKYKKDQWKKYRQELRDLTNTFSAPNSVEWPKPPKQ